MPFPEESLRLSTLAPRLFSDQPVQGNLFLQNQDQTNSNQESEFLRFQQEQSFQQEALQPNQQEALQLNQQEALQPNQQESLPQEEQLRQQMQFLEESKTEER